MSMVSLTNLGFGGTGIPDALPKAVAELQGLTISFVDGAAGDTLIPVAGMDTEDTIIAIIDLTTPANVDVANVTIAGRNAFATITCLATAVDGDTVVVNGKTYTFVEVDVHTSYNTLPFQVPMTIDPSDASDPEEMATRLATAIMSGDSTLYCTVEGDASSPVLQALVRVQVREPGTDGNAYTLTEVGTAVTVSGATFSGGADEEDQGFESTDSTSGKKLLVFWFDKRVGGETLPL